VILGGYLRRFEKIISDKCIKKNAVPLFVCNGLFLGGKSARKSAVRRAASAKLRGIQFMLFDQGLKISPGESRP
jgi:hypothetical protein